MAGGFPKPTVTWWRGTDILPLKSTRFEVNRDYSLVFNDIALSDLGPYICQAYSGQGRPVSMYVTLMSIGSVRAETPEDEQYLQYVVPAPPLQPSDPHYYRPTQPPQVEVEPSGKYLQFEITENSSEIKHKFSLKLSGNHGSNTVFLTAFITLI